MASGHVAHSAFPVTERVGHVVAVTEEALGDVFDRWARRVRAPGVAWGLVRDGALVAAGGIGALRLGDGAPPGGDSVFRIASMTKSFTGAALMGLVADGRLRLDDPVAGYVPELASWRGATSDGPPITVRHLVTMESGLPTDDAWADRHLDLSDEEMDALIAGGAAFAWTPGVRFEYSNLGWGLVGRVIERVAGVRVQELVSSALLEPLGMSSTSWERPVEHEVAEPYRLQEDEPVLEASPLGDGTIAPMGGLWSTVRDLSRWVGFFTDAFPPRDGPDDGPLPRWARREMQQFRRVDELARVRPAPDGPSRVAVTGYGLGLSVRIDERLGVSVGHSGGLPGYGSHMRWLPERGVGVIGLSNVTYGNMHGACLEALEVLADLDDLGPAHARHAGALAVARGEQGGLPALIMERNRRARAVRRERRARRVARPPRRDCRADRRPPRPARRRLARTVDPDAGHALGPGRLGAGRDRSEPCRPGAVARRGGPHRPVARSDRG